MFPSVRAESFFLRCLGKTRQVIIREKDNVLLDVARCRWVLLSVTECYWVLLRLSRNKFKNTAFDKYRQTHQHIMISWYNTYSSQLCIYNPQQSPRIKGIPPMQWQSGVKPHKNGSDAGVTQLDDITYTLSHFFTKTTREHSGWSQWDLNPHTPANQENISS